jgi:hypothetical protein
VNAGEREIVREKEGYKKGSASGSVHWSGYDTTALDIEVDPQRCRFGSRKSDFALQALVELCVCLLLQDLVQSPSKDFERATSFRFFFTKKKTKHDEESSCANVRAGSGQL